MTIPTIFHQTYKTDILPPLFQACQRQILELHPHFQYRFYTDEDMLSFMKTEFPMYLDAFLALPYPIMRVDMFRYFLMYTYGGVYADMDYWMFRPFDLLNYSLVLPSNSNDGKRLGNCMFASEPRHPFWKCLMDTLFYMDRSHSSKNMTQQDFVLTSTGPDFVTEQYHMFHKFPLCARLSIHVPTRAMFHPEAYRLNASKMKKFQESGGYGIHLCTGTWLDEPADESVLLSYIPKSRTLESIPTILGDAFSYLTVYHVAGKERMGSAYDGGYVVAPLDISYDLLLSCGISTDDTFEHEFLRKYPHLQCVALDGTIAKIPHPHPRIEFHKINVGHVDSANTTRMTKWIQNYSSIFLKMDIEGSEFQWLHSLSRAELDKFKQICIEFHIEHEHSDSIPLDKKLGALQKLAETHYCVHTHGNNWRGTTLIGERVIEIGASENSIKNIALGRQYPQNTRVTVDYKGMYPIRFNVQIVGDQLVVTRTDKNIGWIHSYRCVLNGVIIPRVMECTYVHKSLFTETPPQNKQAIPNVELDSPNTGEWKATADSFEYNRIQGHLIPDIRLDMPPYTNP